MQPMLTNQESKTSYSQIIKPNIPLKDKNWFATGGPAKFFAAPETAQEFQQATLFAQANNLGVFVLGEGANILISDDGFDGLVIQPQLKNITRDENLITAGAGVSMHNLITHCLNNNLIGLEEFSGIPGSVGGSVYINLHYFEFLLEQFLVGAQVMHKQTGEIQDVDTNWFNFGYNQSTLQEGNHYLLNATFKLKKVTDIETAYARGRHTEIIRHRHKRYPNKNTCGSFFRNFSEDEVNLIIGGRPMIFVAYYLDKIGVKGELQVGDAKVSHQHANMIVNLGNATSSDIIQLARTMQELVKNKFGITPQPECRLVGFKEYPLL